MEVTTLSRRPLYYDTLFNKPMDATASFAQNLVIPGAATFAAYKYWGKGNLARVQDWRSGLLGEWLSGQASVIKPLAWLFVPVSLWVVWLGLAFAYGCSPGRYRRFGLCRL